MKKFSFKFIVFVFTLLIFTINTNAQEIYYDNFDSYEQMLRVADLIVYGSVKNTTIWEDTINSSKSIIKRDVFLKLMK